jgi:hypothetical protein
MHVYFFHLDEDGFLVEDEEGLVLFDDAAAHAVAVRAARDLLAGAVLQGRLPLDNNIVVTDHVGRTVFSLTLGAAVGLPPRQGP